MRPAKERFYEFMQYAKDSDEWIHQSIQDYVSELEEINADMLVALIEIYNFADSDRTDEGLLKDLKRIIESATGLPIEEALK